MENELHRPVDNRDAKPERKKPYRAPRLVMYGNLKSRTQGGSKGGTRGDESPFGGSNKSKL